MNIGNRAVCVIQPVKGKGAFFDSVESRTVGGGTPVVEGDRLFV